MDQANGPGRRETVWEIVRETIITLTLVFYHWLIAVVRSVIPASIQGKDVSGETVLITGAGELNFFYKMSREQNKTNKSTCMASIDTTLGP